MFIILTVPLFCCSIAMNIFSFQLQAATKATNQVKGISDKAYAKYYNVFAKLRVLKRLDLAMLKGKVGSDEFKSLEVKHSALLALGEATTEKYREGTPLKLSADQVIRNSAEGSKESANGTFKLSLCSQLYW